MGPVLAIFRRELGSAFDSALAYIVLPVFLLLVGVFSLWFNDIFEVGLATMRTVFFWCAIFQCLLVPALTMRLFAEERRSGSIELLVTLPVSEGQLVLGKFLAALALSLLGLLLTLSYPIALDVLGELDWGPVIGGYAGLALMAAAYTGIGVAASASTSNQIVAFLVAMCLCVLPYAMGFFLHQVPASLLPVVQYLSFDYHFGGLVRGVVDTRDLVFYLSVAALGMHVAVWGLEQRRLS